MSTVISTPEGIAYFQLLSIKGRLSIEINTGLKFRTSTLAAVNRMFGQSFRTKRQALRYIEDKINEMEESC
jgi:hypothetical protein